LVVGGESGGSAVGVGAHYEVTSCKPDQLSPPPAAAPNPLLVPAVLHGPVSFVT
jgi:hypothetical protein